jgi:hypothetical protein
MRTEHRSQRRRFGPGAAIGREVWRSRYLRRRAPRQPPQRVAAVRNRPRPDWLRRPRGRRLWSLTSPSIRPTVPTWTVAASC